MKLKEGDRVFILKKGKYKNKSGKIEIITSNGWYHIKTDDKNTIKLRLVDIKEFTSKKTKGQHEAKNIDKRYKKSN